MAGSPSLIPAVLLGGLVSGLVPGLLAGLWSDLSRRLRVEGRRATGLAVAPGLVAVPMMLVAGLLLDAWGSQEVLAAGSLALAVGLMTLAVSRTVGQAGAGLLLTGVGGAGLTVGTYVLAPAAFAPESPAGAANLAAVFFGLGALLGPSLAGGPARRWGLRQVLLLTALAALLPGLTAALTPWAGSAPGGAEGPALASAVPWLVGLALLLEVPLQAALAAWSNPYLAETGHTPPLASVLATGFWLSLLGSRLVAGLFLAQNTLVLTDPEPWLVLLLMVFAAIVLGNLAGTVDPRGAGLGLLAVGALLGPVFPSLIGLVLRRFPGSPGTACGAACAGGALGALVLTGLLGVYARRSAPKEVLRLPLVLAWLLTGVALVLSLIV